MTHGVPVLHHAVDGATAAARRVGGLGDLFETLVPLALEGATGIAAGALALGAVLLTRRAFA